jgi:hypothetical protein
VRRANAKTQHLWRRNCAVPAERSATTRRVSPPSDEPPPRIQTSGAFTLHAAPSPWTAARCLGVNPEPVNRRSRQPLKPVKQPSDHGDRPEDDTGQKAIPEIPRAHFPADGATRPAAAAQGDTGLQRQERRRDADQPDENATDCDGFLLEHRARPTVQGDATLWRVAMWPATSTPAIQPRHVHQALAHQPQ